MDTITLEIPELSMVLKPGNIVQLGRFSDSRWEVHYGWYSFGGNRDVCGWYLSNEDDDRVIKPLQRIDLEDIYLLESGNT